jgi:MFS family permease
MERAATQVATDGAFQIRRPLDALNFFLADVRDGLGPYLAIYLLTVQRWDEASIGLVMSVATLAGLLAQTPAGALVDATRAKRAVVASAALAVTLASLLLPDDPYWLVGVQLLDGVGAGIWGAIFPIVVADLMRGTGRFNVAQGAIITAQGVGAALSTTVAGFVVVSLGYSAAFLTLAGIAGAGLLLFWLAMPETRDAGAAEANLHQTDNPRRAAKTLIEAAPG